MVCSKLINSAVHDTIDERALNIKPNMSLYQKVENQVRASLTTLSSTRLPIKL